MDVAFGGDAKHHHHQPTRQGVVANETPLGVSLAPVFPDDHRAVEHRLRRQQRQGSVANIDVILDRVTGKFHGANYTYYNMYFKQVGWDDLSLICWQRQAIGSKLNPSQSYSGHPHPTTWRFFKVGCMDINVLKKSLGTGEILNIIYHGGTEPGTTRRILPIQIKGDILCARCLSTLRVKSYSLDKIELANGDEVTFHGVHDLLAIAISAGDLISVNYDSGQNSLQHAVIRPIAIENRSHLIAYSFITGTERKLKIEKMNLDVDFYPYYMEGDELQDIQDFRWLAANTVVPLFEAGWLIKIEESYLGIYPRTQDDTVSTSKGYADQRGHLQFIKGKGYQFHVWFDGHYFRCGAFSAALRQLLNFARTHPIPIDWK